MPCLNIEYKGEYDNEKILIVVNGGSNNAAKLLYF